MRKLVALGAAGLLALAIAAPASARSQGQSIVDTAIAVNASTGEFDHLIEAVVRADLVATLDGNRQFTVFAPTDAAFEVLFDTLGVSGVNDIPVGTLRAVLLYHVAPGERFAEDVVSSSRIRTVSKGFLWPSVNGGVYINDAQVIAADIDVSNGVIHVIDRVLLPG
ncbi:MAG TPA: fasciclin domain-containing protein [Jiangellaceae bacterium]|nr:fasciclin domain-containing protein [Jiangellaceae bacterium]